MWTYLSALTRFSFIHTHTQIPNVQTNPKYWDDAEASDVQEAYGEDWEKIAAFTYDGLDYTMVKILEPVLVLAKEDPVCMCVCVCGIERIYLYMEMWNTAEGHSSNASTLHTHSLIYIHTSQDFKGITKWILPSEDEAEEVAPIMEGIIKVKLGIDDLDDDEEEDEEEEE